MLTGLVGICMGTYALLDQTAPRWLVLPGLVGGVALAAAGFWSAGRRVQRSRYRPDPWRWEETGVALSGFLVAAGTLFLLRGDPVLHPPLDAMPTVTTTSLLVVLCGLLAVAVVSPAGAQPVRPSCVREVADARAA